MKAAKNDAVYRREDGLIIIDPEKAKGQKQIVDACPYGAVFWNEELDIPQKCTGCAHLLDNGEIPHCIDLCVHKAIRFGDLEEFANELDDAVVKKPENKPHVYYLNLPKLFVSGEVWDPKDDECIENAEVVLNKIDSGESWSVMTDNYGDFWFKRLDEGDYVVTIKKEGFLAVAQEFTLDKSTNLGDYPLKKC
jgi:Fe-S-cluster-containing dehydrogenase component